MAFIEANDTSFFGKWEPDFNQDKYVTDFQKKAELFNSFFAKQCSIIQNCSKLSLTLSKKSEESITSITFNCNDIATIIRSLAPKKAHNYDMISICMLKICGKPICKPLELTSILHQTRKIPQWIENAKCGSCAQEKWLTDFEELSASISNSHLWEGFWVFNMWD